MKNIEELVREAQTGKKAAFEELCRRFTGLVRSRSGQSFARSVREDMEGAAWLAVASISADAVRAAADKARGRMRGNGSICISLAMAGWRVRRVHRREPLG